MSLDGAKLLPSTDSNTVLDVQEKDANVFAISCECPLVVEGIGGDVVEVHARIGRVVNVEREVRVLGSGRTACPCCRRSRGRHGRLLDSPAWIGRTTR